MALHPPRQSSAPKEEPIDKRAAILLLETETRERDIIESKMLLFGKGCSAALNVPVSSRRQSALQAPNVSRARNVARF